MSSVNYVHVIGQVAHKYHSSSVNSQNKVPCVIGQLAQEMANLKLSTQLWHSIIQPRNQLKL